MASRVPEYLKPGDCIAIAASARKTSAAEMQPAISMLNEWGLQVELAKNLFLASNQYAGTDEERISGLQELLNDGRIKAVLFARGGYGSIRIVDRLDWNRFAEQPKWLAGFSDITVLHGHLEQQLDTASIHSCMAFGFTAERFDVDAAESLRRALFGETLGIEIPVHPLNKRFEKTEAELCGGNLSVLYSMMGSVSEPDYTDKILFLEDLDEYLYHIDRMMMGLKRAGKLKDLRALVVGYMSEMKDNAVPFGKDALQIIADAVAEYDYPVVFGLPCGHEKRNLALRMGMRMSIWEENGLIKIRQ